MTHVPWEIIIKANDDTRAATKNTRFNCDLLCLKLQSPAALFVTGDQNNSAHSNFLTESTHSPVGRLSIVTMICGKLSHPSIRANDFVENLTFRQNKIIPFWFGSIAIQTHKHTCLSYFTRSSDNIKHCDNYLSLGIMWNVNKVGVYLLIFQLLPSRSVSRARAPVLSIM